MGRNDCYFNGIDGETGSWFQDPLGLDMFAEQIFGSPGAGPEHFEEPEPKGLAFGTKPDSLAETGWGVILPANLDPSIRDHLQPLLDHRGKAATRISRQRFKTFEYWEGETKQDFLLATGAPNPGMPIDPDRMPYYLLIVGTPQEIPFEFQYRLATDYAVGRICFDRPEDYGAYANSVVTWEYGARTAAGDRNLTLFGVRNPDDTMTRLTTEYLVDPLCGALKDVPGWRIQKYVDEETGKTRLVRLMGGDLTPDLLFTVAHGLCYRAGYPHQRKRQGALVCREWPGPKSPPKPLAPAPWPLPSTNGAVPSDLGTHGRPDAASRGKRGRRPGLSGRGLA